MNANGTGVTATAIGPFTEPDRESFSPDGTTIVTSDGTYIYMYGLNGSGRGITSPGAGLYDSSPCFSPDGRWILYAEQNSSGTQLWKTSWDGSSSPVQVTFGDVHQAPACGPFPQNRNIIGAGSYLATGATGFLMGEIGDRLSSFVAFTTTTPSTANIVAQTQTVDNTVFQLKGDAITKLAFMNDIFGAATVIVPVSGMTTIGGALVSFNSTTGKVVLVAPFSPGVPKMTPTKIGSTLTYAGRFAGIWNRIGKNVAPNGASSLSIDSKTGALVSFK